LRSSCADLVDIGCFLWEPKISLPGSHDPHIKCYSEQRKFVHIVLSYLYAIYFNAVIVHKLISPSTHWPVHLPKH